MTRYHDFRLEEIEGLIEYDILDFAIGKIHDLDLKETEIVIARYPLMIQHSAFKNDPVIRRLAIENDFRIICSKDFDPTEDEINLCLDMLNEYGSDLVYNSVEPYDMIWGLLESMHKEDPVEYKFIGDLIRLEKLEEI